MEVVTRCKKVEIPPQVHRWEFPDGHGIIMFVEGHLLIMGCATGYRSFVMSCSFTNQTLAQIELGQNRNLGKYEKNVYIMPKVLDEKVAHLHLKSLGVKPTELPTEQAECITSRNLPLLRIF